MREHRVSFRHQQRASDGEEPSYMRNSIIQDSLLTGAKLGLQFTAMNPNESESARQADSAPKTTECVVVVRAKELVVERAALKGLIRD
jgi:hypothetical protein